ncbi:MULTISPECIES: glucokinase [unclassified Roseateles]|uniref:glucokinase n=1 Tax=unclassified Roseateles TaxID=2626991 RepID=UPI0006F51749|nr:MULTISPECIES: glucokinase [unclassified Roseateles]KQW43388.1 glucokinase [Pelomonas sp. Root405]KRA71126.1 glucokinase [Pelomonas sp. Root662]
MSAVYPWLVADIGGTNARFGIVAGPGAAVEDVRVLSVAGHAGLAAAVRTYVDGQAPGSAAPRSAALALATAITDDRIELTNGAWGFSRAQTQAELGLQTLICLNDFEAQALSLPRLKSHQLRSWGAPPPPVDSVATGTVMAVIGPGTGLGVGGVVRAPGRWLALPGEGGHVTLAPADDFESAVLSHARREFPHVSAERFLSGIGLPVLCRSVAAALGEGEDVSALPTEQIVARGLSGESPACVRTLDVFCAMLGGFAGSVALTLGSRGGVFIGGGIVPRLGERFFQSEFRARFEAKGRFQSYLEGIPTALITDTLAALSGAALALEQADA